MNNLKNSITEKLPREYHRLVSQLLSRGTRKEVENSIREKWRNDLIYEHLAETHKEIYFIIHRYHYQKTGRFPNITDPKSYNDKIAWLMLFDQDPNYPLYADKLEVRNFIKKRVGDKYLTKLLDSGESLSDIDFSRLPSSFVIKTNHDSGSVFIVKEKNKLDIHAVEKQIKKSLKKSYGYKKGEWMYQYIPRKIMVEEYLGEPSSLPPPDFKFHCVDGKMKWLRYTYDRGANAKEATFDRNFQFIPLLLDQDFVLANPKIEKPANWEELVETAEKLADGFRCVRVDLYNINGRIVFGEITFYPKAGCYTTPDNEAFGKMLDFDLTTTSPPVYNSL